MNRHSLSVSLCLLLMPATLAASAESPDPCPLSALSHVAAPQPTSHGSPNVLVVSPDVRLVRAAPDIVVQQLKGREALNHLTNLMSRHPQAFAQARDDMLRRGFRETNTVYVERTVRLSLADSLKPGVPMLAQDYSEANEDGEIVFWSSDDGDDSTWEGTIYFEHYDSGRASMANGQIDASTEEHPWVWYEVIWQGGPGDDGPPRVRQTPPADPSVPLAGTYRLASLSPAGYILAGDINWRKWYKCYRATVVGGCVTAAGGCLLSGPKWPLCFAAWCGSLHIGSAITCYMML